MKRFYIDINLEVENIVFKYKGQIILIVNKKRDMPHYEHIS